MKRFLAKTLAVAAMFAAAATIVSCGDDDTKNTDGDPYITIDGKTEVTKNIGADKGEYTLTVDSNIEWELTDYPNTGWISVTPKSGGIGTTELKIVIIQDIGSNEQRTANYDLKPVDTSIDVSAKLTVIQNGADVPEHLIQVTPLEGSLSAKAGTFELTVSSNVTWTVSSSDPSNFALSTNAGTGDGTVVVTYTENVAEISREANITFTSDAGNPVVALTQQGASGGSGEERTIAITIESMKAGQTSDFPLVMTTYDNQTRETPYTWSQDGFDLAGFKVCISNKDGFIGSIQGQGNDTDTEKQMLLYNNSSPGILKSITITFSDSRLAYDPMVDPKQFTMLAGNADIMIPYVTIPETSRELIEGVKYISKFDLTGNKYDGFKIVNNYIGALFIWSIDVVYE